MLFILFGLYQFTFSWSELPVAWTEQGFSWLGNLAEKSLPDGPLKSMIISGVIDGVGGVLGFVPLIMFMFFGIAVLEDSGYLARVAFMMDRVFRIFGLHGSSVMPFIVSGGIAGGISQALITTQMGLAVSIPGLIVNGILSRRQKDIELELAQIKDILCTDWMPEVAKSS